MVHHSLHRRFLNPPQCRYNQTVLLLLACADPPILCIDGSILGTEGCPEVDTGSVGTAPLLTAQQALDTLSDLLDIGIPEARTPGEIYGEMMSHVDDDCPGQDGGTYALLEPCTTAEGYTFSGVSSWESGTQDIDGVTEYVFSTYQTSMTASTPTGETLTVGGILGYGGRFSEENTNATSWLAATVHYPSADSWLSQNTSSDMRILVDPSQSGGFEMEMFGGYSIEESAVYFDELSFEDDCVTGTLRARDSVGEWYVLTLTDCSGCGGVTVGTLDLGEACIDLTPALTALLDVMVTPP